MYSLFYMTKLVPKLKIRNQLADFRAKSALTQQALAEAIGVTRMTIIAIEKGDYNPSLELSFRLAKFFKTNLNSLFQAEDDEV